MVMIKLMKGRKMPQMLGMTHVAIAWEIIKNNTISHHLSLLK